jgi:hypothetical protein
LGPRFPRCLEKGPYRFLYSVEFDNRLTEISLGIEDSVVILGNSSCGWIPIIALLNKDIEGCYISMEGWNIGYVL